jgi:hypothetical protein
VIGKPFTIEEIENTLQRIRDLRDARGAWEERKAA